MQAMHRSLPRHAASTSTITMSATCSSRWGEVSSNHAMVPDSPRQMLMHAMQGSTIVLSVHDIPNITKSCS